MNDPKTNFSDVNSSDERSGHEAYARFWLGFGLPSVILAATYTPFLWLRSGLPDRVASHFDGAGRADDSMTVNTFLVSTSVLVVVGLLLSIGLALHRRPIPAGVGATAGFLGPFIAALGGGILVTTAVSQRDLDDWMDAPNAWWSLVVVLVSSLAAGTAGGWLGSRLAVTTVHADADTMPVMDLGDGEQAVWTTSLRSTQLFLSGIGFGVVGVVLAVVSAPWLGISLIGSSVVLTALATVHVRVDRNGLRVRYGRLRWPQTFVAVDRIAAASVIDVRPMEWGGWGYRGSLTLTRQAAVVHRAGPGIRLDLIGAKTFVVTVDNPEVGVALLNAQVTRLVVDSNM